MKIVNKRFVMETFSLLGIGKYGRWLVPCQKLIYAPMTFPKYQSQKFQVLLKGPEKQKFGSENLEKIFFFIIFEVNKE